MKPADASTGSAHNHNLGSLIRTEFDLPNVCFIVVECVKTIRQHVETCGLLLFLPWESLRKALHWHLPRTATALFRGVQQSFCVPIFSWVYTPRNLKISPWKRRFLSFWSSTLNFRGVSVCCCQNTTIFRIFLFTARWHHPGPRDFPQSPDKQTTVEPWCDTRATPLETSHISSIASLTGDSFSHNHGFSGKWRTIWKVTIYYWRYTHSLTEPWLWEESVSYGETFFFWPVLSSVFNSSESALWILDPMAAGTKKSSSGINPTSWWLSFLPWRSQKKTPWCCFINTCFVLGLER